jgi:diguanylate cyclase (GGDEF)-like protein
MSLPITDFANTLCKISAVPVFTTAESLLGYGPIGGSLLSPSLHGQMLGNLAKEILAGQDINAKPIVDEKSVYYSFDNNVLSKFSIPLERLPENSIVINKPFSAFETYRTQIFIVCTVFLLLVSLIFYLFHNIKLRKKVEADLITNNEQLTALYEEMAASQETLRQNFNELTAQKKKINKLAYFDTITRLPNRAAFQEKLNEIVKYNQDTTLFFIDLDNFKMVNDSFGHSVGDKLLSAVAERLGEIIRKDAAGFRLGGDEFIIICPYYEDRKKAEQFAQNIINILSKPYYVENNYFHINASIGIVFSPDSPSSCDDLLKSADMALYHSKGAGKGTYTFYSNAMGEAVLKKVGIQNDLHKAIEDSEFTLYYQPIIDLQTGRLTGLEALIRWQHPVKGLIAPDKFISIAEESGKMIEIGAWVIKSACRFIKELYELGHRDFHISVNVSAIQLLQTNFAQLIGNVLTKENLPPGYLMLEITESVLIESFDQIISTLLEIRQTGVKIALDDFGCGYSSLTYLKQLPIDVLKIDKTFVDDILQVNNKECIIGSIIMLAKQMGLSVIAEGVEKPEQTAYLKQFSCDAIQGYLISKPVPKEDISAFLMNNTFPR